MSGIFHADSPLLRFLTRVADLMILNVVFLATSLPVVTLGASLTALNYTAMRIAADAHESVTGDYLRSFRENFRQATLLGLAVGFLGLVPAAWYVAVEVLDVSVVVRFVLQATCYLMAFRVVLVALYAFPYLAKFENTVPEVLNNARKMSIRHLFASLAILLVTTLPVVVTVFYPAATAYGLAWFLIGFAGIAFVNARVFTSVFGTYIPPADAESAAAAAPAAADPVESAGTT
ncbi:YesL family protein [Myceligenerans pegani]|uniref:YesL family protein n=1 Tax=Myceligenerans pegani TaxID=2776917 RepID=A0ABR9MXG6_9MICO|nr:YesL family protein [Myceligenerans sp. TRM 65318]MBE1876079.1 YesL family protein [Myceligenerans sp. TRM 65318]MBE3018350.1 YesL family protein [Myceligenerans sp. TRM 65318]